MSLSLYIKLIDGPLEGDKQYVLDGTPALGPLASFGPRREIKAEDGGSSTIEPATSVEETSFWGIYMHNDEGFAQHFGDVPDGETAQTIAKALAETVLMKIEANLKESRRLAATNLTDYIG